MFVRVRGASFKSVVDRLVGNSKASINISLKQGKLRLQLTKGIVIDKYIDVIESDGKNEPITVELDSTIKLIRDDEPVNLTVIGDILQIQQEDFTMSTEKGPEVLIEEDLQGGTDEAVLPISMLSTLMSEVSAIAEVSRETGEMQPDINVINGMAIMHISNAVVLDRINLENMWISSDSIKQLLRHCSGSVMYRIFKEQELMEVKIGDRDTALVTIREENLSLLSNVETIVSSLSPVIVDDISRYVSVIDIICQVYKRVFVDIAVCKDGLRLQVNNISTNFKIGAEQNALFTIRVSSGQLHAISRLFGNSGRVQISKGDNKICLQDLSSKRQLILSGTIY